MKIIDETHESRPNGVVGVIYGPEGIGKTSLAAALDKPLFFDAEKGAHGIKVARIDEDLSFISLMSVMQELTRDHGGYRTFVLDTADAVEVKMLADLCAEKKIDSIEDIPYGKGYTMHAERFAQLLEKIRAVADSGMNVVIVAHAEIRKFELPDERGSYDRWTLKLSKQTAPKLKECADFIVFINYKTNIVAADKKAGETKSHATGGRRWCYTSHTTAFDAKCRCFLDLPEECSLDEMVKKLPVALRNAVSGETPVKPSAPAKPTKQKEQPAEEKAKAALAAKRAAAPAKPTEPKHESKPETAEIQPAKPLVVKLRKTMKTYNVSEGKLFDKFNVRHTERYGEVSRIDDWHDDFIDWILRGFAMGKIKLS